MEAILHFFVVYAPLVYFLLAIGLLFALRRLWQLWSEGREVIFNLEREMLQRRMNQAIALIAIVIFLALAELILQAFLAPGLPALSSMPTSTLNLLTVPTNTLPPELAATLGEVTPMATSTVEASGCIPGQIMITSPKPGDRLSGQVTLTGTANIPNFGFYKYEVAPLGTDLWTTIQAGRTAVQDGDLGRWDTSELTSGDYLLRLVVLDNQGSALPPCVVPLSVVAP